MASVGGAAVPVIPKGVVRTVRTGSLGFQLSANGTLAFVPGNFDRKRFVSVGTPRPLRHPTFLIAERARHLNETGRANRNRRLPPRAPALSLMLSD